MKNWIWLLLLAVGGFLFWKHSQKGKHNQHASHGGSYGDHHFDDNGGASGVAIGNDIVHLADDAVHAVAHSGGHNKKKLGKTKMGHMLKHFGNIAANQAAGMAGVGGVVHFTD
jgi:hypothetical protein